MKNNLLVVNNQGKGWRIVSFTPWMTPSKGLL